MKKSFGIILAIALSLSALLLTIAFQAGWVKAKFLEQETRTDAAPTIVSYQGQIWDGPNPFEGIGYFKFAIVNDRAEVVWSNDGEIPEPFEPIELNVVNGLFSVNLGDTSIGPEMDQVVSAKVFVDPLTFLRVWFSETQFGTYTQLPDQPIASVPYALRAESAKSSFNTTNLGGVAASAYQLRVTGTCPEGSAVRVVNQAGTVSCQSVPSLSTFTLSTVANRGDYGFYVSIATGSDGLGLISYMDWVEKDLLVAHCDDLNCTSAESFVLDETGDVGSYSSIAIGTDGRGVIAYYDGTNGALKVAKCADVVCSSAATNIVDNTLSAGFDPAIVVRDDGNPVIAYHEGHNKDLKYVRCTLPDCSTSSAPVTLNSDIGSMGEEISMVIGTDGFPLITYFDDPSDNLQVIHCQDAGCLGFTDHIVDYGYYTRGKHDIVIGANGFGLISYQNQNLGHDTLMIAVCWDLECSYIGGEWKYTIFEGKVDQYADINMIIGADGLALITFGDWLNGDLKIAHCDNELCSTATTYTLDAPGLSGRFNSITLGSDGLGLIAFSDQTNSDLMVAHCSNAMCIPINFGEN